MKVCMFQDHSENNRDLWKVILPNHMEYCSRHDLDKHPWMSQQAAVDVWRTEKGKECIKVLPVRELQSTPNGCPEAMGAAAWREGDFIMHFLGMSDSEKLRRCSHFVKTREVIWMP